MSSSLKKHEYWMHSCGRMERLNAFSKAREDGGRFLSAAVCITLVALLMIFHSATGSNLLQMKSSLGTHLIYHTEMNLKGKSKRDLEQSRVTALLQDAGYRGTFVAGTGFGKTRVMWKAIIRAWKEDPGPILILVPFEHLKDRFKDELMHFSKTEEQRDQFWDDHVRAECYASISKLNPDDYWIVAGDEAHLGMTDKCFEFYTAYERKLLFCTATEPEDAMYRMKMYQVAPLVYKISLDECVKKGFVAPYHITCIGVDLTEEERKLYKTANRNFGHWKNQLSFDAFGHAQMILKNTKAHSKDAVAAAVGFFRAIRQRKALIDTAENKIHATTNLLDSMNGRVMIFGGNVAFTETLSANIEGSQMYHSKNGVKRNRKALADFKSGACKRLVSVKALNQGLDIPNASNGIICGLTSKALTMIQRLGRLVRIDPNNPTKLGTVFVVYVKDSQEEKWLKNALRTTDPNQVTWGDLGLTMKNRTSIAS